MKIAFVGQKGIPAVSGGVEKHVEELAKKLVEKGNTVYVYTRRNYTARKQQDFHGVKLISLPSINSKHLDAISHTFFACLDLMRRRVDLIHFHSIGPSSLIWLVKLLKPGVSVVATFHTRCYFHKKWGGFARLYLKFGEYVLNKFSDAVITVSRELKNYSEKKYGKNAVYIPNGVRIVSRIEAKEIKRWGLEKDSYLVAVSRLVKHKGLHLLIEAYKKIDTIKKLVIVGDGSFTDRYVKELKKQAQEDQRIVFTGLQSGNNLVELFSNAYFFVQPSESEGLSIALLEAMSYKKAALVSDIPENLEAVGKEGLTFKSGDAEDLRLKMERLLKNNDLIRQAAEQGYTKVRKSYDWEDIAGNTIRLYNDLIFSKKKEKVFKVIKNTRKLF